MYLFIWFAVMIGLCFGNLIQYMTCFRFLQFYLSEILQPREWQRVVSYTQHFSTINFPFPTSIAFTLGSISWLFEWCLIHTHQHVLSCKHYLLTWEFSIFGPTNVKTSKYLLPMANCFSFSSGLSELGVHPHFLLVWEFLHISHQSLSESNSFLILLLQGFHFHKKWNLYNYWPLL